MRSFSRNKNQKHNGVYDAGTSAHNKMFHIEEIFDNYRAATKAKKKVIIIELIDLKCTVFEFYECDKRNARYVRMDEKSKIITKCAEKFRSKHHNNNRKKRNVGKESNDDVSLFDAIKSKDNNELPTYSSPNDKDKIAPSHVSKITSSCKRDEIS